MNARFETGLVLVIFIVLHLLFSKGILPSYSDALLVAATSLLLILNTGLDIYSVFIFVLEPFSAFDDLVPSKHDRDHELI